MSALWALHSLQSDFCLFDPPATSSERNRHSDFSLPDLMSLLPRLFPFFQHPTPSVRSTSFRTLKLLLRQGGVAVQSTPSFFKQSLPLIFQSFLHEDQLEAQRTSEEDVDKSPSELPNTAESKEWFDVEDLWGTSNGHNDITAPAFEAWISLLDLRVSKEIIDFLEPMVDELFSRAVEFQREHGYLSYLNVQPQPAIPKILVYNMQ